MENSVEEPESEQSIEVITPIEQTINLQPRRSKKQVIFYYLRFLKPTYWNISSTIILSIVLIPIISVFINFMDWVLFPGIAYLNPVFLLLIIYVLVSFIIKNKIISILKLVINFGLILTGPMLFLIGSFFFALGSAGKFMNEMKLYPERVGFLRNISILGFFFYILGVGSLYLIYRKKLILYQWLTNSFLSVLGILFLCMFFLSGWFWYFNFVNIAPWVCTSILNSKVSVGEGFKLLCTIIFDDKQLGQYHIYSQAEEENGLPVNYKIVSINKGYPICKAKDLKSDITLQSTISGELHGVVTLTNQLATPCIFSTNGNMYNHEIRAKETSGNDFSVERADQQCPPTWLNAKCPENGNDYIILKSGKSAKAGIVWGNWCAKLSVQDRYGQQLSKILIRFTFIVTKISELDTSKYIL